VSRWFRLWPQFWVVMKNVLFNIHLPLLNAAMCVIVRSGNRPMLHRAPSTPFVIYGRFFLPFRTFRLPPNTSESRLFSINTLRFALTGKISSRIKQLTLTLLSSTLAISPSELISACNSSTCSWVHEPQDVCFSPGGLQITRRRILGSLAPCSLPWYPVFNSSCFSYPK